MFCSFRRWSELFIVFVVCGNVRNEIVIVL